MRTTLLCSMPALLGVLAAAPAAEESLTIGPRGSEPRAGTESPAPAAEAGAAPRSQALREKLEYYRQVERLCVVLSPKSSASETEKQAAVAELTREKARAAEMLIACLNPANKAETPARLGALKAVELVKPDDAKLSYTVGATAAADSVPEVRSAAISVVKTRNDELGIRTMIGHLLASYDDNGLVTSKVLHDTAVGALRELGDKRVYQALFYRATLELRLTNVSEGSLTTRSIDSFSNTGGNFAIPQQLSFPIQTPELSVTHVATCVCVPALVALHDVSGQNFGEDWDKWDKWLKKLK